MYIYLQCSNCGAKRRVSNRGMQYTGNAIRQGWGSYGSALYCPECSKTWDKRNPGRPMASTANTFWVIAMAFKRAMERGR